MFHMKQIYTFLEKAKPELEQYILLLKQWQKAVNLVSNATLNNAWERHIVDYGKWCWIPCPCFGYFK